MSTSNPTSVPQLELLIQFSIDGVAQPRGSKTVGMNRATGRPFLRDDNKKSGSWMDTIRQVAGDAFRTLGLETLIDGPLLLRAEFHFPRPDGHFGSGRNAGRIKDKANAFPTGAPDLTKLIRALEDSLNKVVIRDDSRIVAHQTLKCYGETAKVFVSLYRMPSTASDLWAFQRTK